MQCEVYDTYVQKADGELMHFDIIVPGKTDYDDVVRFGQQFLNRVGQPGQKIETERCRFCHVEQASAEVVAAIEEQGFFILEMEGCPSGRPQTNQ